MKAGTWSEVETVSVRIPVRFERGAAVPRLCRLGSESRRHALRKMSREVPAPSTPRGAASRIDRNN
jgi:hypothetical protein